MKFEEKMAQEFQRRSRSKVWTDDGRRTDGGRRVITIAPKAQVGKKEKKTISIMKYGKIIAWLG